MLFPWSHRIRRAPVVSPERRSALLFSAGHRWTSLDIGYAMVTPGYAPTRASISRASARATADGEMPVGCVLPM